MSRPGLVDIVFVLDRSGSMQSVADDAIGGFNGFLSGQRELPGEARLTLVLFDNEYLVPFDGAPLSEVPPLNHRTYVPRGSTALLDAMGRAMQTESDRIARAHRAERPAKILFAVLTDGQENASHEYSHRRIMEMIRRYRDLYGWEIIFLSADEKGIEQGEQLGFAREKMRHFDRTPEAMASVMHEVSDRARMYRKGEAVDFSKPVEDDDEAPGGDTDTGAKKT